MSSGLIAHLYCRPYLDCRYVVAVILRKRNEALLAALEERKESYTTFRVNDEVEAVKHAFDWSKSNCIS